MSGPRGARVARRGRRWIGWAWLGLASVLPAQEQTLAVLVEGRQAVTMRAFVLPGSGYRAGLGFAEVTIDNVDDRAHEVECELRTGSWSQGNQRVTRGLQMGAGERAHFFLPLPSPLVVNTLLLRVDGEEATNPIGTSRNDAPVGLFVGDRQEQQPLALAMLASLPSGYDKHAAMVVAGCPTRNLPSDWRLMTGFDALLVDGAAALAEDQQEAVRRYVFAGGLALVAAPGSLPAGGLRALFAGRDEGVVSHGLGRLVAMPSLASSAANPSESRRRLGELEPLGSGPLPVPSVLSRPQPIPGLGDAPVRGFLTIILLFAIVVGPLNFMVMRRRRRPLLALVTIPVLGFGTTLLLLGYGLVHDGFGIRGSVVSWTCLDQVRHEGVTVAASTLFAGSSPRHFELGQDALVLGVRSARSEGRIDRWFLDAGTFTLDGGVLPSRTPTPLLAVQQGPERARLLVRVEGESLRLLADGGVVADGQVVLRDLQGQWWLGKAPVLQRASANDATTVAKNLVGRLGALPVQIDEDGIGEATYDEATGQGVVHVGRLAARMADLPPGGYLLTTRTAPWRNGFGVAVAHDAERHHVSGRLAAEDFVR
ncbi:MAG: hypothetical protein JNL12_14815 [Planctomycetes bacterium]|nr:hypothetical protein [Planctomycetota bacterium]